MEEIERIEGDNASAEVLKKKHKTRACAKTMPVFVDADTHSKVKQTVDDVIQINIECQKLRRQLYNLLIACGINHGRAEMFAFGVHYDTPVAPLNGNTWQDELLTNVIRAKDVKLPLPTKGTIARTPIHKTADKRMQEVKSLLDNGWITAEEYETKRKEIVDGI
ncbi:MAG: SHOCT domain-containing protein [Kiritimatiellae bacterium]|nr:SHOCT domain-containing protein [Kiritimatiellia bacterium]